MERQPVWGGLPEYLTVQEMQKYLGIGRTLAYQAVRRGEIPSLRIGQRILIPRSALEAKVTRREDR